MITSDDGRILDNCYDCEHCCIDNTFCPYIRQGIFPRYSYEKK